MHATVLVVEDEPAVRSLMTRILRQRGYTPLEAANGRQALEIANAFSGIIDLLITDVIMPGMSGGELAAQLDKIRPGIKALFISGYGESSIARHVAINSEAILRKPFTIQSLENKMRRLLRP